MQKYKITIVILGVVLAFILAGYFLVQNNQKKEISSSIDAVPISASLIIEIQNLQKFYNQINTDSLFIKSLRTISYFDEFNGYFSFFNEKIKNNETAASLFANKSLLISVHLIGKDKIENLYLMKLSGSSEIENVKEVIGELNTEQYTVVEKEFDEAKIYQVKFTEDKSLYYCFTDNNFIFSFSDVLVEKSILQIQSQNPVTLDTGFKKVSELNGINSLVNFYVNFTEISKILEPVISKDLIKKNEQLETFANWSALDFNLNYDNISFTGLTHTSEIPEKYLAIMFNQEPVETTVQNILPEYTYKFVDYGISNAELFYENYKSYLTSKNLLEINTKYFNDINKKYDITLDNSIIELIDNELFFCSVRFNFLKTDDADFIISKTKSNAKSKLWEITEAYAKEDSIDAETLKKAFELENEEIFTIYKFPFADIFTKLLGELYDLKSHNYYCFIDDYLIFSGSTSNLVKFANAYYSGEIFSKNSDYEKFTENILPKSNFFYFNNTSITNNENKDVFNEQLSKIYAKNSEIFSRINAISLQFSFSEQLFYTSLCFNFKSKTSKEPIVNWGVELDSSISIKPKITINHNTNKKEVFIQDLKNNIYLISNEGEILWKKNIGEKIVSEVYQIDYYKNNKLQIIFNTKTKIYIIDRNGDNVEKYPVTLKSPATAGLSVFDYDNNKTYRIFIPCSNKKVYLYNLDGTINDGWKFEKSSESVTNSIQLFSYLSKDYILFADKLQTYILDRKGDIRIKVTSDFPKSQNNDFFFFKKTDTKDAHFVTTNSSGSIETIFLDGSIQETKIKEYTFNHFFYSIDLNNDGKPDYIFVDSNTMEIYDNSLELLSSAVFDNDIELPIQIFNFSSNNIKIGISDKKSGKIYLYNSDGSIYQNFPIEGNSLFSIGIVTGEKFSLITSYKKGTLYNYQIE